MGRVLFHVVLFHVAVMGRVLCQVAVMGWVLFHVAVMERLLFHAEVMGRVLFQVEVMGQLLFHVAVRGRREGWRVLSLPSVLLEGTGRGLVGTATVAADETGF